jgi:hypothetical protein
LALASGNGRYITVTPERELVSVGVGGWPLRNITYNIQPLSIYTVTVSLGSRSGLKYPLGLLESSIYIIVFKAETTGVVMKHMIIGADLE